nr:MAG TPA: hypothetical protein [Inoviridae sp.]
MEQEFKDVLQQVMVRPLKKYISQNKSNVNRRNVYGAGV